MGKTVNVGFEVHIRLGTARKLFSEATNANNARPNTCVSLLDLGVPGCMPTLNREALRQGTRLLAALGLEPARRFSFDRKHYTYPDLPSGFQLTQYFEPLFRGPEVCHIAGKEVPVLQIHLECDAAKTVRSGGEWFVDYNRAGVPLAEVVTGIVSGTPKEAVSVLRALRYLCITHGVGPCDMSLGDMRFDVNVSTAGTLRQEIKNMNSFGFAEAAIEYFLEHWEEMGTTEESYTWEWSEKESRLVVSRVKEPGSYYYLPEPDLPSFSVGRAEWERTLEDTAHRESFDRYLQGLERDPALRRAFYSNPLRAEVDGLEGWRLANMVRVLCRSQEEAHTRLVREAEKQLEEKEIAHLVRHGALPTVKPIPTRGDLEAVLNTHSEERHRLLAGDRRLVNFFVGVMTRAGFCSRSAAELIQRFLVGQGCEG